MSNLQKHEAWSFDEQKRFVEGLKLYRKDWRKVKRYIGTRTVGEI